MSMVFWCWTVFDVGKRTHAHTHTHTHTRLLCGDAADVTQSYRRWLFSKYLANDDDLTDRKMIERETFQNCYLCLLHTHTHTHTHTKTQKFKQPHTPNSPHTHTHCVVELSLCVCVVVVVVVYWGLWSDNQCGEPPAAWLSYKHLRLFSSYSCSISSSSLLLFFLLFFVLFSLLPLGIEHQYFFGTDRICPYQQMSVSICNLVCLFLDQRVPDLKSRIWPFFLCFNMFRKWIERTYLNMFNLTKQSHLRVHWVAFLELLNVQLFVFPLTLYKETCSFLNTPLFCASLFCFFH